MEIQYVDIGSVSSQGIIEGSRTIRFGDAPSRARRLVRHGDTIVATVRTYLRAIAFVDEPPENMVVSTGFAVVRPSQGLHARFLWRILQSEPYVAWIVSNSEGVSYPAIAPTRLAEVMIPVPPEGTQTRIGGFLHHHTARIDALIAKKRRLLELLEEKRQAVIGHAVAHREFGARQEPVHVQVKHIVSLITSGPRGWGEYYAEAGRPFIRVGDLGSPDFWVSPEDIARVSAPDNEESRRAATQPGDVLVAITGATTGAVGIVPPNLGGSVVNQHIALIRPGPAVRPKWLACSLASVSGQDQLLVRASEALKEGLSLEDVGAVKILLPPALEQDRILASLEKELSGVRGLERSLNQSIRLLEEKRSALITAAVTGQLDVSTWTPPAQGAPA